MGLKQFFGDSILKLVQEARERQVDQDQPHGTALGARIADGQGMPAMVVYRIANGYIAQSFVGHNYGNRQPAFHYCPDHQAIADFVVAEASRQALGLNPTTAEQYGEQTLAKASQAIRGASHPTVMAKPNY